MIDTTWKPTNPCKECGKDDPLPSDFYEDRYYDFDNNCHCSREHDYYNSIATIRGLIEWLLAWGKCDDGYSRYREINRALIVEMQKKIQTQEE